MIQIGKDNQGQVIAVKLCSCCGKPIHGEAVTVPHRCGGTVSLDHFDTECAARLIYELRGEESATTLLGDDQGKHWPIEFLLSGKTEWYPGSELGTNPQDAIKMFLENYSQSMGTIVGIRVPSVPERA